jgi:hypothetical protein
MHISLDSALGRQRRLNSVGESVLQVAPNAAAAYSLRSLTGGDPKVVRVRRDTDNAEQDFTASEVSSGALTSFTNADYATYTSDFSSGDDSWGAFDDVTETGNIDGIGGLDNNLRLAIGSATSQHRAYRSNILPLNQKINFSARVFIPSTNSVVDSFGVRDASGSVIIAAGTTPAQDQWVTVTANDVTVTNAQLRVDLQDGGTNTFAGNGSDVIYLREITVTQVTSDGFVDTWYDQSGNGNDAVQATAGSQPKIVSAGALVTGGLDFDGTARQLTLSNTLGITSAASHFAVTNLNDAGGADILLDNRDSSTDGYSIRTNDTSNINFDWLTSDAEVARISGQSVYYFNKTSSQVQSGANGGTLVTASESGSVSVAATPRIGARSFTSATNFLEGTINELIIYNTDQTDNRTAIEANINSHYSIF